MFSVLVDGRLVKGFAIGTYCYDGIPTLRCDGYINIDTGRKLREKINECLALSRNLIIDLSEIDDCDCAGVDVLVRSSRQVRESDGNFVIVVPKDDMHSLNRILGITNDRRHLNCRVTLEEARNDFPSDFSLN